MTDQPFPPTEPISTLPKGLTLSIPEAYVLDLGEAMKHCLNFLSKILDLRDLDGVTIAEDYGLALTSLDRGYQSNYVLTATKDFATGVAMSPRVLRDGQLKTHILLDAGIMKSLADMKDPEFAKAFYVLAHECAHVEVTARFEAAFPGQLLRRKFLFMEGLHWSVILPAWNEYGACRKSYGIGYDLTDFYEQNLLDYLEKAPAETIAAIDAYRNDPNGDHLLIEVYRVQGVLLKYASYYLGHLAGAAESWENRVSANEVLAGSWFHPFLKRLDECLTTIWAGYGEWPDQSEFEEIGNIVDDMTEQAGVYWMPMPDGSTQVQLTDKAMA